ncbi:MAG: beta strand repeat-containing protein [Janthinobacterium lividum]
MFTLTRLGGRNLRRAALGLLLATAGAAQAQTTTFTYTGGVQNYFVPQGVSALRVVATGASGGEGYQGATSGRGAQVQATIRVTPGELLVVTLGGRGTTSNSTTSSAGGNNGGGTGGFYTGSGGGATDLRRVSTTGATSDYLTTRNALLVAGGGGGGGGGGVGGSGGIPNGVNGGGNYDGGRGAQQTGVGSGGTNGGVAGNASGGGSGSSGSSGFVGGGGGGGGYYGGGGGDSSGGGGGGGSSWATAGASNVSYSVVGAAGNGSLTITPVAVPAPTITSFNTPTGAVGSQLVINGTNLDRATSVRFGELPARPSTISVNAAGTQLTVTVPVLASNNAVSVTTPTGTATSTDRFQVTRANSSLAYAQVSDLQADGSTIKVGTSVTNNYSAPTITDLDGNGLLDLLVGKRDGDAIARYEQISANATTFTSKGSLQAAGSAITVSSFATLAVTDLDGNGLLDLLVGNGGGLIARYEQTNANATTFTSKGSLQAAGSAIKVSGRSTPTVTDLDGNGLLDLLVGNEGGLIARYEQTSANAATFTSKGSLQAAGSAITVGNDAAPTVSDLDGDGLLDLLVGNAGGYLSLYKQTSTNAVSFVAVPSFPLASTQIGGDAEPVVTDLDGDGRLDLLVGNFFGTVARFVQVDPPTLTNVNSPNGPVGTSVTLTGTNLSGATAVSFNGISATTFAVVNATTLTATVPSGATTGPVTVTTPGGTSNGVFFRVTKSPLVLTSEAENITASSATLGGGVADDNDGTVTSQGVVYSVSSTNATPAIGGAGVTQVPGSLGSTIFTSSVTGLAPATAYSVRAYATNSVGTSYGNVKRFTTLAALTTITAINRVGSSPTNAGTVSYTVTFADAVTGLSTSNFALVSTRSIAGPIITSLSGAGTTYTLAVNTGTGDGNLRLDLVSAAGISPGLSNAPPFVGQVYTIDKTAPTVTLTSTIAPDGGYTTTSPLVFLLTFSEGVTPRSAFSLGAGATNASITRIGVISNSIYEITATPNGPGPVTFTVVANSATDAAGNGNSASLTYTINYNVPTAAPVVTAPADGSLLAATTPTYTGTAPAGSTVTLYLASGGGAATAIGTTTATGGSFSLTPTTTLADGTYVVYATALASGQLVSANSNTNTFTIDGTAPTATVSTTAGSSTSTAPIPFSVSFSEPVTGFSASGITVTNGTVSSGPTGSGSGPYTFRVTPTGNGVVSVRIAANAAQDAVGNASTASATTSVTYTAPVATGLSVQYQTGDLGQPTDGQVRPFLQLVNSGTTTVPYSSLTVRYWLTVENFMGQLVTPIDYAKLGTSFVSARYVQLATPRQGALGYIEYSFAAGAGSLAPGTDSGPIYGKAYKPDYTNLDETDDWSYQTSSSFTENSHVTVYQNGTLVNGTEPPAVTATTALQVLNASRDAATSTQYLSLQLQVRNTGNVPVNYGDVKVRYYFTRDGATSVVPQVDYAKLGASNISLRVVNLAAPVSGADAYLEVTFSAALGVFYPRTSTDDILVKLRKDNYQAFDQSNDYTFSGSTMLMVSPRFPAYLSNALVFGTPPTGAPAIVAAPTNEASATATSPADASIVAAAGASRELTFTGSPNPFGEQLHLTFALPTAQAYTLALYDGQGRLVQLLASGQAEAGQAQELAVPTQGYATGLYLVRLTTATGVQHLKLIKQ